MSDEQFEFLMAMEELQTPQRQALPHMDGGLGGDQGLGLQQAAASPDTRTGRAPAAEAGVPL